MAVDAQVWLYLMLLFGPFSVAAAAGDVGKLARAIPRPLERHPGNVFLAGEEVTIELAESGVGEWHLVDYDARRVASGSGGGEIRLGPLEVGYYEVVDEKGLRLTSAAVLAPLSVPTPADSPINCDVSMAWFYPEEKFPAVASLCALAGLNWVRDRCSWPQMQPQRGEWAARTKYDESVSAFHAAGLRVLNVNHHTPSWAGPERNRFPLDLRDAYRLHRDLARRWRGRLDAFEPWNEATAPQFGGHTGAEIASMQKASYLGMKAGDPDLPVCQNTFGSHYWRHKMADFHANQPWPYFDTFNFHHYRDPETYAELYDAFRGKSGGMPLWITEANFPVDWEGGAEKDPTPDAQREQARRVPKVFATSLYHGSAAVYYFILPNFVGRRRQYGLLRPDFTPYPAYAALAATGRLLAGAQCLGRIGASNMNVRGYLFRALPDGVERVVLVAWMVEGEDPLELPRAPLQAFDHLGRPVAIESAAVVLTPAPVFLVLEADAADRFEIEPASAPLSRAPGDPCPVVLQIVHPPERTHGWMSAYRVSAAVPERLSIFAYNFRDAPAEGVLRVKSPPELSHELPGRVRLDPRERKELILNVDSSGAPAGRLQTMTIRGEFGPAGKAVLSFRLLPE
jgi:hypothetical protein